MFTLPIDYPRLANSHLMFVNMAGDVADVKISNPELNDVAPQPIGHVQIERRTKLSGSS